MKDFKGEELPENHVTQTSHVTRSHSSNIAIAAQLERSHSSLRSKKRCGTLRERETLIYSQYYKHPGLYNSKQAQEKNTHKAHACETEQKLWIMKRLCSRRLRLMETRLSLCSSQCCSKLNKCFFRNRPVFLRPQPPPPSSLPFSFSNILHS